MRMTSARASTQTNKARGDPDQDPLPMRAPLSAETEEIRGHVAAALRAMLDVVEVSELDLTTTESGVSLMLEHDNVRCVLVVSPQVPRHTLSPRELQIARLVAEGATNRAIASALDISLWTVSTHMRRIFAKLGVCSRAEMVAQFYGCGDAHTMTSELNAQLVQTFSSQEKRECCELRKCRRHD
jgi:DNA-binding CsgD family transcriptional regulator